MNGDWRIGKYNACETRTTVKCVAFYNGSGGGYGVSTRFAFGASKEGCKGFVEQNAVYVCINSIVGVNNYHCHVRATIYGKFMEVYNRTGYFK